MKSQQRLLSLTKNFPYLTHPFVLMTLLLTAVNDHYLKYKFSNLLTGKISDFTGLFFFPLLLCALFEFIKAPAHQHKILNQKQIILFIIITDFLFIICKYTALREHLIVVLGVQIVADYSDLWALSVNGFTYVFAKNYFTKEVLKSPHKLV